MSLRVNRRIATWIALYVVVLALGFGPQAVLLLVPLTGAVIVRRRTGETSALLLATSGAAVGTTVFSMIVWATMGKIGGRPASLLAIATLVSLAMLCAATKAAPDAEPRPIEWPSALESVGFATMFAIVALSILVTSTALLDFSETMIFHVPLVASMQRGNVPPMNLSEPPHALYYHYGQHTLAAALASFGGLRSHNALFVSNAWYGAIATGYAYALVRRAGSMAAAFAAALLFAFAGTLNWIAAYADSLSIGDFLRLCTPLDHPFTSGNIALGSFVWRVHGNSMAWACCAAFLTVDLLDRAVRTRRFELAVAAGFALGVLAPANETLFAVVALGIAVVPIKQWIIERRLTLRPALLPMVTGVLGVALVLFTGGVLKTFFLSGSATHGASIYFDFSQLGTVASWNFGKYFPAPEDGRVPIFSLRFLQDVGPVPFLLVPAFGWLCMKAKKGDGVLLHVAASAIIAFVLGSVLRLTKYEGNTFRLVNLGAVLSTIPVGAAIVGVLGTGRSRALPIAVTSTFVVFNVSSWPLMHLGILANEHSPRLFPPADGGEKVDREATDALVRGSSYRDGVLSIPHDSWAVLSSGQVSPFGSFVGDRREYRKMSREAIADVDLEVFAELSVRYLYVDRRKATTRQIRRIDMLVASNRLAVFWQDAGGLKVIYEVVPTKP